MADQFRERRKYPRVHREIALEAKHSGSPAPLRATTSEISIGGCYIETMFTLDVGTKLDLILWLDGLKVPVKGVIATRYPQVGNGIDFVEIASDDRHRLEKFLAKAAQTAG